MDICPISGNLVDESLKNNLSKNTRFKLTLKRKKATQDVYERLEDYCLDFFNKTNPLCVKINNENKSDSSFIVNCVENLLQELFNEYWTTRQGAALALNQILQNCSTFLTNFGVTKEIALYFNLYYLHKIRLFSFVSLCLDRFYDFTYDDAYAPVIDVSAQLYTNVSLFFKRDFLCILDIFKILLGKTDWRDVFPTLVCLKYLCKSDESKAVEVIKTLFLPLLKNFVSKNEEPMIVICKIFITTATKIIQYQRQELLRFLEILLDAFLSYDELNTSLGLIAECLSTLLTSLESEPDIIAEIRQAFFKHEIYKFFFVIWQLIQHPSSHVRSLAFNCLSFFTKFLNIQISFQSNLDVPKFNTFILFFCALTEFESSIRDSVLKVFEEFVDCLPSETFLAIFNWWIKENFNYIGVVAKQKITLLKEFSYFNAFLKKESLCLGGYIPGVEDPTLNDREIECRVTLCRMTALFFKRVDLIPSDVLDSPIFTNKRQNMNRVFEIAYFLFLYELLFKFPSYLTDCTLKMIMDFVNESTNFDKNIKIQSNSHEIIAFMELQRSFKRFSTFFDDSPTLSGPFFSYKQIRDFLSISAYSQLINRHDFKTTEIQNILTSLMNYESILLTERFRPIILSLTLLIKLNKLPEKITPFVYIIFYCLTLEFNYIYSNLNSQSLVDLLKIAYSRPSHPEEKIIIALFDKFLSVGITAYTTAHPLPNKVNFSDDSVLEITENQGMYSFLLSFKPPPVEFDKSHKIIKNLCYSHLASNSEQSIHQLLPVLYDLSPELFKKILDLILPLNLIENPNLDLTLVKRQFLIFSTFGFHIFNHYKDKFSACLECILTFLSSKFTLRRYFAAKALSTSLFYFSTNDIIMFLTKHVVVMLNDLGNQSKRLGALETIYLFLNSSLSNRKTDILYETCIYLLLPILRLLNDNYFQIRYFSSFCLSIMLLYVPITSKSIDTRFISSEDFGLIKQLLDSSSLKDFEVPFEVDIDLRSYQKTGINWLNFLREVNLNGALCDDMGLGKTIQTLILVASDHFLNKDKLSSNNMKASLVVCPCILVHHWFTECGKYIPKDVLIPVILSNFDSLTPDFTKVSTPTLFIATYQQVRIRNGLFEKCFFNYVVLDEAHLIKNIKTKTCKAVSKLTSLHKLALTGTPIQNDVLELWSLFNFLMPGFLGVQQQFQEMYAKPILRSRESSSNSVEYQKGMSCLDSLQRRCLPFILRRMKEDVLKELPPKIIQDFYCELSEIQHLLYQAVIKDSNDVETPKSIEELENFKKNSAKSFQVMLFLRQICNHLAFVLNSAKLTEIKANVKEDFNPNAIENNCKLGALQQILSICGFDIEAESYESTHKIILFSQHSTTLEYIQRDLLALYTKLVCLRLDGTIPIESRSCIVDRFNSDNSVHLLLSTTSVGGLGLNLTSADTVIFYDHNWNPMRDLQAMDRAHRLGQKRAVNVYRIICKDTIEEKIMNLQSFKLKVANAVVSDDNKNCESAINKVLDVVNVDLPQTQSVPFDEDVDLKDEYQSLFDINTFADYINKLEKIKDAFNKF